MCLKKPLPKGELVVVLFWSLSSFVLIYYNGYTSHKEFVYSFATTAITFPLAGWLADVYLGRYKVIHYSLWLEVAASISYNVILLAEPYLDNTLAEVLRIVAVIALAFGLTGVAANIIQFGFDQMTDASSSDISSYIDWFSWTLFLATIIIVFSQTCLGSCFDSTKITFFIIPFFSVLALSVDLLANGWLLKEPVTHNPLKSIYQVLRYAIKNKYPRMRSAFTYWEDKPYTRIDLGKRKYGGPFSTEQVEDVKTFFRVLALMMSTTVIYFLVYIVAHTIKNMRDHLKDPAFNIKHCKNSPISDYLANCYQIDVILHTGDLAIVVLVPVAKLGSYTKFKRLRLLHLSLFGKLLLGLVLLLLFEISLLAIEVTGILVTHHNFTCFLCVNLDDHINGHVLDTSYKWMILPQLLFGLAKYTMFRSGLSLICSQTPYSMRGLLIGLLCYVIFVPSFFSKLIYDFVRQRFHKDDKYCGLWFYLAVVVITAAIIVLVHMIKKCYSFRRRDEDVHNEHMFAVDYYDKYLPQRATSTE